MKTLRINYAASIMAIVMSSLLTGCFGFATKGGHTFIDGHCVTCLNNPVTGEALNYDQPVKPRQSARQSASNGSTSRVASEKPYLEGGGSFTVRTDVDTVYTRIKREFGFLTRKEWGRTYLYLDNGFVWEALPGVNYSMRLTVPHTFRGVKREHYIEFNIDKSGSGTDVSYRFWAQIPKASLNAYSNSIKTRALRAIH